VRGTKKRLTRKVLAGILISTSEYLAGDVDDTFGSTKSGAAVRAAHAWAMDVARFRATEQQRAVNAQLRRNAGGARG